MESFPAECNFETMKSKELPDIDCSDILMNVRKSIWEIIEKDWKDGHHFAHFVIGYDCRVFHTPDKEGLVMCSQTSYNTWPFKMDFRSRERLIYDKVVATIAKELVARFGAYFTTLHETHWDSECFRFYIVTGSPPRPLSAKHVDINHGELTNIRDASNECRVEFPMP